MGLQWFRMQRYQRLFLLPKPSSTISMIVKTMDKTIIHLSTPMLGDSSTRNTSQDPFFEMPRDNTTRNRLRQEPVQSLSYDSLTTNMISPQQQGSQHHPSTPYYYPSISHQYSNLHYYHPHLHLPNLFIRPNYISFFPHPFHFLLSTTYGQESNFKPPVPNQRPIKLR